MVVMKKSPPGHRYSIWLPDALLHEFSWHDLLKWCCEQMQLTSMLMLGNGHERGHVVVLGVDGLHLPAGLASLGLHRVIGLGLHIVDSFNNDSCGIKSGTNLRERCKDHRDLVWFVSSTWKVHLLSYFLE